ncbi:hypothetical protein MRS44_003889 [Fusarium solani]|uniref:uncharacterized protein n=1 Tax=Fusarium solani TaxID=169388 RepID=UPI0032C3E19C|nr:hypothetical protein MRS44_003889 [Fusarium solani]
MNLHTASSTGERQLGLCILVSVSPPSSFSTELAATTKDMAKEERHEDGTIESRFELIQQMEPDNEVDEGIADDDLPDILGLSKRVTASRKRKERHKIVDLTKEALTPEPDGDINHPPKRSRGELPSAEEVQCKETLPQELQDFEKYDIIFFPIHHGGMEH